MPQQPLHRLSQDWSQSFTADIIHDAPHLDQDFHRLLVVGRSAPRPWQLLAHVAAQIRSAPQTHPELLLSLSCPLCGNDLPSPPQFVSVPSSSASFSTPLLSFNAAGLISHFE